MTSLLIAGSGGQGILLLGKLIAQAAMLEGKNVTWFPSYGAEMRGGTANCTVTISEEAIGSPIIERPDVLVALNGASRDKFSGRLRDGGLMVLDSSLIEDSRPRADVRLLRVPASAIAESVGNAKAANMVLLGAIVREGIVKESSALSALREFAVGKRKAALEVNEKALRRGKEFIEDKKGRDGRR